MRIVHLIARLLAAGAQCRSAQTTAFVGGRVIDGTGRVIENGTVVINGGKITAVGPASTPVPAGATRVDLKGKTLLPGPGQRARARRGNTVGCAPTRRRYTRENLLRQLQTYAHVRRHHGLQPRRRSGSRVRRCATKTRGRPIARGCSWPGR